MVSIPSTFNLDDASDWPNFSVGTDDVTNLVPTSCLSNANRSLLKEEGCMIDAILYPRLFGNDSFQWVDLYFVLLDSRLQTGKS